MRKTIIRRIKEFIKEKFPKKIIKKILLYRYLRKMRKQHKNGLMPRARLDFNIHLVDHCNLNCKGCEHFSSLAGKKFLELETFEKDCARIVELTNESGVGDVYLLGGEPLLHPQIVEFICKARKYFPTGQITIITNGILLSKQTEEFWKACQQNRIQIIITVYPIKIDYDKIKQLVKLYNIDLKYWGDPPEIGEEQINSSWQRRPLDLQGTQNIMENYQLCYMANGCIQLVDGKIYTCAIIAYIKYFNAYFNKNLVVTEKDYIDIYKVSNINEIFDFLSKPMPFCRYCNIRKTVLEIEWGVSKKNISEWISYELE